MNLLTELTGWLATYALHSTILLALAALLAPRLRSDAWRETLWRTALLGALLTTTVQAAVGHTPVIGRWTFDGTAERVSPLASVPSPELLEPEASLSPAPAAQAPTPRDMSSEVAAPADDPVPLPSAAERVREPERAPPSIRFVPFLVAAWLLVATVLLGRLGLRQVRLFRVLRSRRPLRQGPLAEMLAELRRNAGVWTPVRLSASPICPTPVAFGWSEICVPERFLSDLAPDQQRSALAHELAHLTRRDPVWELSAGVMEALFFFQPLNRFARFRLRDAAENLCDDWAVRETGSPLSLARCLTDIASWVGAGPEPLPTGTMAMAEGGSSLLRRVQRLAEHGVDPRPSRFRFAGATALLVLMATAAPAISLTAPQADSNEGLEATGTAMVDAANGRENLGITAQQDLTLPSAPLAEQGDQTSTLNSTVDCEFSAPRSAILNTAGASVVEVDASAGSLRIEGQPGISQVRIRGRACSSIREVLDDIQVVAVREGGVIQIEARLPDGDRDDNASLDMAIQVPINLPLDVQDSSGDTEIRNVTLRRLDDSSGDVAIVNTRGDVRIRDSSGFLRLHGVQGDIWIDDSSGDIEVEDIQGSVSVDNDSSGDIRALNVRGDFTVNDDSSGDIRFQNVEGTVRIPPED